MALTDAAVKNAKAGLKPVKLFDERGLFLLVTQAGGKWWRLKYIVLLQFDSAAKPSSIQSRLKHCRATLRRIVSYQTKLVLPRTYRRPHSAKSSLTKFSTMHLSFLLGSTAHHEAGNHLQATD
jgi:hypothetical protein